MEKMEEINRGQEKARKKKEAEMAKEKEEREEALKHLK